RGVAIPGINDAFAGSAPDVGVYESALDVAPSVLSITRVDANPTAAAILNFTVTFSEPVNGLDLAAPFADFALTSPGLTGVSIAGVTPVSGTTYTVAVNSGSGAGTLRLDIVDDDSITDAARTPLGGPGAGNGAFTTGEAYTVDKSLPAAISILRTDPTPTAAGTVHFAVTFTEAVTGVDTNDFLLAVTGNIGGAVVTEVLGSANAYSVTVDVGTGDGTLRLDLLDNDSIVDAGNTPLGGPGAGNGNFVAGEIYTINRNNPTVVSILRADADPSTAENVRFGVSFSEPVTGVDSADFTVAVSGPSGARVLEVTGSGAAYIVNVATGTGNGSLRLDVVDNDSIIDLASAPLGGPGAGNGNFAIGETYTINKPVTPPVTKVTENFRSNGANDGWVLESGENSERGGSKNTNATTFILGDDARDRQYRAFLHFPTVTLPDNAQITMLLLMIKKQDRIGTDPFTTHGNILIDIRSGAFGSFGPFPVNSLQVSDFQFPSSRDAVGAFPNNPVGGWYWAMLDTTAFQYVNRTGVTQFRLRFQLDDNDDLGNDYLRFYSGNYSAQVDRPQLSVEYYVP
ncbi:MAG: Ig-like domain-containing protein, partial [Chloroflexota bacterium]